MYTRTQSNTAGNVHTTLGNKHMYKLGGWQLKSRLCLQLHAVLQHIRDERKRREMKRRRRMMRYRGGWSHYYMHSAVPITQYMAASNHAVQPTESADHNLRMSKTIHMY